MSHLTHVNIVKYLRMIMIDVLLLRWKTIGYAPSLVNNAAIIFVRGVISNALIRIIKILILRLLGLNQWMLNVNWNCNRSVPTLPNFLILLRLKILEFRKIVVLAPSLRGGIYHFPVGSKIKMWILSITNFIW